MLSKSLTTLALAVTVGAAAVAASRPAALFGQEEGQEPPEMEQPTEHHARILEDVGEWEGVLVQITPDGERTEMPAEETVTAFGEFWTVVDFECDFMDMPYRGHGQFGYDAAKGKYVGTWIDSMTSYLSVMEGHYDEETGAMVLEWTAPDWSGEMTKHRSITMKRSDVRVSQFFQGEGDGTKTMEIRLRRVAGEDAEGAEEDGGR